MTDLFTACLSCQVRFPVVKYVKTRNLFDFPFQRSHYFGKLDYYIEKTETYSGSDKRNQTDNGSCTDNLSSLIITS